MWWLIGCWNTATRFGMRRLRRTPVPESWTSSSKKPKPPIARGRRPRSREIKRVAGFVVLRCFQCNAARNWVCFPLRCRPATSGHFARILPRIDAGPHPGPLPSNGREDSCRPRSVDGGLSGISSRGYLSETAEDSPSPGGEGRGEVEPFLRALHSAVHLRSSCGFAALCSRRPVREPCSQTKSPHK